MYARARARARRRGREIHKEVLCPLRAALPPPRSRPTTGAARPRAPLPRRASPTILLPPPPRRSARSPAGDPYFYRRPINDRRARVLHAFAASARPIRSRIAGHFGPCGGCAHVRLLLFLPRSLRLAAEGVASCVCACTRVCARARARVYVARARVHRGRGFSIRERGCCARGVLYPWATSVLFRVIFEKSRGMERERERGGGGGGTSRSRRRWSGREFRVSDPPSRA
jgi:hypothetical protein